LLASGVAHRRECREVELSSQYAGQREQLEALRREVAEPAPDHLADPLRHTEAVDRVGVEPALLNEQPNHLADEEGVALRFGVDRVDERSRRSASAGRLD